MSWRLPLPVVSLIAAALLLHSAALGQVILGPSGPEPAELPDKAPDTPQRKWDEPEVIQLSISAAGEPRPALQYSFVPDYLDLTPGNAVPYYYRSILAYRQLPQQAHKTFDDNYDKWLNGPLEELPKDEAKQYLSFFSVVFSELKTAVYREECDWDWRLRDLRGTDVVAYLLPEVQEQRSIARLLSLKARVEIAEGRYDDAIETMKWGFRLARDVAKPPTLINDLVGIAIASIMLERVRELIDAPDSPNLYWALASLPAPLIDMREALMHEMSAPRLIFPFLKNPAREEHSADEWRSLLVQALSELGSLDGSASRLGTERAAIEAAMMALAIGAYPRAKRDLIAEGMPAKKVEQMPVGQVIAIHQERTYRHAYSEMFKWTLLPYHESWRGAAAAEQKLQDEGYIGSPGRSREIIPLASLLLPATSSATAATVRFENRIAGLRALEAIRMHMAENDGRLPADLKEIAVVPVPVVPGSGEPFVYRQHDNGAVLEIPGPAGQPVWTAWKLELSPAP